MDRSLLLDQVTARPSRCGGLHVPRPRAYHLPFKSNAKRSLKMSGSFQFPPGKCMSQGLGLQWRSFGQCRRRRTLLAWHGMQRSSNTHVRYIFRASQQEAGSDGSAYPHPAPLPEIASRLSACCGTPVASDAGSRPSRSHLQVALHQTDQTTERTKSRVTVTDGDGNQVVYHTSRRDALHHMLFGMSVLSSDSLRWMWTPRTAQAALVQFPATSLHNKYFLVRAGEGESEAENYVLTNPVAKTSMSSGLSQRGKAQVVRETAPALRAMGACSSDCWLWPSITQRSYQTAEILGALLGVGRSRIVPEYSFLDPRGMGALEGLTWDSARAQVTNGDQLSPEWRPPRGTDGTPNESVSDVLVRVRQVLSITETQYSGANVIVVAPDSDNLSVLQAALLGLDLRRHADLAMRPGEVRAVELAAESPAYYSGKVACARPPNCL